MVFPDLSKTVNMAEPKLTSFIYKVLKQVAADQGISKMASEEVEKINHLLIAAVMKRVNLLIAVEKRKTVKSRTIEAAIRMVLPEGLRKHAISEGTKAVTKFNASLGYPGDEKEKPTSVSVRAGLTFPTKRIETAIRKLGVAPRVGVGAPVFLTAVLEALTYKLFEAASEIVKANKKVRVTLRFLREAITAPGSSFGVLLESTVLSGGVVCAQSG